MKKILSFVLVLALMLSTAAFAEASDLTGDWYGEIYGAAVTITLNEDGSYSETVGEETVEGGTWAASDNGVTMDPDTDYAFEFVLDEEGRLVYSDESSEVDIVLGREPVEVWTPAEANTAATEEDFAGDWSCYKMAMVGMTMDPEYFGMGATASIDGMNVTISISLGELGSEEFTAEGTLADGVITVIDTTNQVESSESTEDGSVSYTITALTDGTIAVAMDAADLGDFVFYMNK